MFEELEILDMDQLQKNFSDLAIMNMFKQKQLEGYKITIHLKKLQQNNSASSCENVLINFSIQDQQSCQLLEFNSDQRGNNISTNSQHLPEESAQKPFVLPQSQSISILNKLQINQYQELQSTSRHNIQINENIIPSPKKLEGTIETEIFYSELISDDFKKRNFSQLQLYQQNEFLQNLNQNSIYQKLGEGILAFERGNLKDAIEVIKYVYIKSTVLLWQNKNTKEVANQYKLICVKSLCYISIISRKIGQIPNAIRFLEKLLNQYEINDLYVQAKIYLDLGTLNFDFQKLSKALEYFYQALQLFEKLNYKCDIAFILIQIALIYAQLGNIKDAKKLCYEGIIIYKQYLCSNDLRIGEAYHILGQIYFLSKQFDLSKETLLKAIEIKKAKYQEIKLLLKISGLIKESHKSLIKSYNMLGIVCYILEEFCDSVSYFEYAVKYFNGKAEIQLAQVLNNLGLSYLKKQKFVSAKICFDKAVRIYQEFNCLQNKNYLKLLQNQKFLLDKKKAN